jgi:acetyl-CoA decarbonylase/synthase complex subunit alpha
LSKKVINVKLSIGKIISESEIEPFGPTPFPTISQLRNWDHKLLSRYKPLYLPECDLCCLCTMGKCDLTGEKRGACGIDMAGQKSRMVLLSVCIGASTHTAQARHLTEHLIERFGRDHPLNIGGTAIEAETL